MYYDINKIMEEELESVNYLIAQMKAQTAATKPEHLTMKAGRDGVTYHRRFTTKDNDDNIHRSSEKLGDEFDPRVIEVKQDHYNRMLLEKLQKAKRFLESNLGKYESYDIDSVDKALPPVYRDITGLVNKDPVFMSAREWSLRPYKHNRYPFPDDSNVTSAGERVRSKSEIILHDQMTFLGIPFQSDADIPLTDETGAHIHKDADFLIGSVHGRKPILEHLGNLTNDEYLDKAKNKLKLYIANGYTLNKDLFLTADDRGGKINAHATMQLLKRLILPKVRMR